MALKQCKLNEIPTRNRDLAFGYVKECERRNKSTVPSMIKYLCLIYLNQNKDSFDPNNTHKDIKINADGDELQTKGGNDHFTICLRNITCSGINIWKFKCKKRSCDDSIGITKAEASADDLSYLDYEGETQIGYAFAAEGRITNPKDCYSWGDEYGNGWEEGDIIEMRVDFNKLELTYKVNETPHGKAFDIDHGEYKAALSVYPDTSYDASYQLLSYQHIY